MKRHNSYNSEHGSIFIYILIAIALFASLTYAIGRDKGGSSDIFTEQQTKITAQAIIEYGNTVAGAVQKLKLRGCDDNEISFENSATSGYINANAPASLKCHIFEKDGGNINHQPVPKNIQTVNTTYHDTRYSGSSNILDVGTIEPDLFLFYRMKSKEVCMEINDYAGIFNVGPNAPSEVGLSGAGFTGTYASVFTLGDDNDGSHFLGQNLGCYEAFGVLDTDGASQYDFYQVLIAR